MLGNEAIIHVQDQLHLLCRSMFQPFHDDYLFYLCMMTQSC